MFERSCRPRDQSFINNSSKNCRNIPSNTTTTENNFVQKTAFHHGRFSGCFMDALLLLRLLWRDFDDTPIYLNTSEKCSYKNTRKMTLIKPFLLFLTSNCSELKYKPLTHFCVWTPKEGQEGNKGLSWANAQRTFCQSFTRANQPKCLVLIINHPFSKELLVNSIPIFAKIFNCLS